jgi:hypothetical protein
MPAIETFCPQCAAPLILEPAELLVLVDTNRSASGTYLFRCADCEQVIVRRASPENLALLARAGATTGPPRPPAARAGAGPFTRDDLLDFHMLLASGDRLIPLVLSADRHTSA